MKKIIIIPFIFILILSLCSCSSSDNSGGQECIVDFFGYTYYEDSVLYFGKNSEEEPILCCYSIDTDTSAVMCSLPECTHARKTSPDCVALRGDETLDERGYNIIGDKMYYISVKTFDEDAKGSIDLMECDLDGRNKRVAASIENKIAPFISDVKYSDNNVYITYIQKYDFVKDEDTGKFDFVDLDKSEFYIQKVEIPTGSIETLVYREDYDGGGYGAVYDNVLYYYYSYYTEKSTGEMITPDTKPRTSKIAFYTKDLSTGEEKEYQDMSLLGAKLGHLSSDRIMVYDNKNKKLLRFNTETEEFKEISDFDYSKGSYTEDENYAVFGQDDNEKFFSVYNFESGEISQVPYPSVLKISLNLVRIVGDTVWMDISDSNGDLSHYYIGREDFYAGKFENISKIKDVDLQ